MKSRIAVPRSHVAPSMSERVESRIAKPIGILRAVVREGGKIVDVVETRNTIVNHGVAAIALSLLPSDITMLAASGDTSTALRADGNPYAAVLPINHWRMGAHATAAANAPDPDDDDLQYNTDSDTGGTLVDPPLTGDGAGPWYVPLTGSHFTAKAEGTPLADTHDIDAVAGFTVGISMPETAGNGPSGSTTKTYREAGLFFYYPTGSTPPNPFGDSSDTAKVRQERLFARATLEPLVKTPTRQISLTWRIAFPATS